MPDDRVGTVEIYSDKRLATNVPSRGKDGSE